MEQIAIITRLVQEMSALNCSEMQMEHFIHNLDAAVRTLSYIREDTPRQMARDLKREAERPAREAEVAKEKEEKRVIQERQAAYWREKKNARRRELYQLKKMKGKICDRCEEFPAQVAGWNWCGECCFQHACNSFDCEDNCVCLPRKEKCVRKEQK